MVDADQTFVIVGGGLAGAKAAETLRAEGFTGRVILICDERDHPYERPPLSKGYLLGSAERDSVFVHEPGCTRSTTWSCTWGRPSPPWTAPRRPSASARTAPPSATTSCCSPPARNPAGSTSPAPTWPASTICAASPTPSASRASCTSLGRDNGHLVIAGAGWIGLEIAAAARHYGAEVTVVHRGQTPLHSVLGPELGMLFAELHREHGVRFHFSC
ncbi:NADPH-dependent 2,4-dienoyl-CoA reductase/sulfur reductase-like enzyme OS=Streptomyces albaduncus OX=68172 GN=FHS32_000521 PE=4 SV=1 [Streptomyces griseoloalbus]